jgi:hypothetical protein
MSPFQVVRARAAVPVTHGEVNSNGPTRVGELGRKRQRGIRSNGATEYQLHCAVVDTIRRWILPGWIYNHIASGEKRDQATAARLKGTGVVGGFPDLNSSASRARCAASS